MLDSPVKENPHLPTLALGRRFSLWRPMARAGKPALGRRAFPSAAGGTPHRDVEADALCCVNAVLGVCFSIGIGLSRVVAGLVVRFATMGGRIRDTTREGVRRDAR